MIRVCDTSCYPIIGTQDKFITFLSNWVKESELKLLIFMNFRYYLQHGRF